MTMSYVRHMWRSTSVGKNFVAESVVTSSYKIQAGRNSQLLAMICNSKRIMLIAMIDIFVHNSGKRNATPASSSQLFSV